MNSGKNPSRQRKRILIYYAGIYQTQSSEVVEKSDNFGVGVTHSTDKVGSRRWAEGAGSLMS